ncbi:MAG: GGDEF domain-containing protein [Alphaproteobacteria bacterium]
MSDKSIQHDIKTIRDIETALEEAENFIGRVKGNKVRLTLQNGNISISREEMAKITDLVITLERSGKALEKAVKYLRELMAFDEVTGMFSRRYIFHLAEKELHRAQRYESPFSILVIELDLLSGNEHIPHLSNEDTNLMVAEAARAARKHVRDSDSPGRTGERTFMLLLPETDAKGALILAERIRTSINKKVDVSVGKLQMNMFGAILSGDDPALTDMAGLLFSIDQKLTEARDKGVNCIVK